MAETAGLEKSMLKKILHYSDVGVALLMVLVVVMMVIPLPTGLIDVLLAANITLGVVVLLVTFYYLFFPVSLFVSPAVRMLQWRKPFSE